MKLLPEKCREIKTLPVRMERDPDGLHHWGLELWAASLLNPHCGSLRLSSSQDQEVQSQLSPWEWQDFHLHEKDSGAFHSLNWPHWCKDVGVLVVNQVQITRFPSCLGQCYPRPWTLEQWLLHDRGCWKIFQENFWMDRERRIWDEEGEMFPC